MKKTLWLLILLPFVVIAATGTLVAGTDGIAPRNIKTLADGTVVTSGGGGGGAVTQGTIPWVVGQATGTNLHVVVDSAPTTAVTGTFWQATQPVSGTFWQATQPVSGTFWQATQPVSGPLTDAQLRATPVPISGSISATNPSVSTTGSAVPASGTYIGINVAGNLTGATGTANGLKVDGSAVTQPVSGTFWQATQPVSGALTVSGTVTANVGTGTQPVSGTFWQATQPVSGTFWQVTQPVSIASMPSTPVTGTFWQATQPVSGPLTDTQLRASAVPVSGTFWQATQPISGTVTANAGTGTFTVGGTVVAKIGKTATAPLSTAVSVTTSATALPASALANRISLCVYNNGASTIYLGASGVTTANGLPLPAGGVFCEDANAQVYYGIVAAGTVDARILEN